MTSRTVREQLTTDGRLRHRRAVASLARDEERRYRRHEELMQRRNLSPPHPAELSTPEILPAPPVHSEINGGRRRKEPIGARFARFKQRKDAEKLLQRQRFMCQPPFRAGKATTHFSVFDTTTANNKTAAGRTRRGNTASGDGRGTTASGDGRGTTASGNGRGTTAGGNGRGTAPGGNGRGNTAGNNGRGNAPGARAKRAGVVTSSQRGQRPATSGVRAELNSNRTVVQMSADRRVTRSAAASARMEDRTAQDRGDGAAVSTGIHFPTCTPFQPPVGLQKVDLTASTKNSGKDVVFPPFTFTSATPSKLTVSEQQQPPPCVQTAVVVKSSLTADAEDKNSDGNDDGLSIDYFRCLVSSERTRLAEAADLWDNYQLPSAVSADTRGDIQTAQGQARLLMRERFVQFSGLIDQCEQASGALPTTLTDLQGFWEMIKFQVDDVDAKMARLQQLKQTGWLQDIDKLTIAPSSSDGAVKKPAVFVPAKKRVKRLQSAPSRPTGASAGLRAAIAAARQRLASANADLSVPENVNNLSTPAENEPETTTAPPPSSPAAERVNSSVKLFSAGFFQIQSPPVSPDVLALSMQRCQQADLRRSAQMLSAKSRRLCDLSPLVTVSSAVKTMSARRRLDADQPPVCLSSPLAVIDTNIDSTAAALSGSTGARRSRRLPSLLPGMSPRHVAAPAVSAAADLICFAGTPVRRSCRLTAVKRA